MSRGLTLLCALTAYWLGFVALQATNMFANTKPFPCINPIISIASRTTLIRHFFNLSILHVCDLLTLLTSRLAFSRLLILALSSVALCRIFQNVMRVVRTNMPHICVPNFKFWVTLFYLTKHHIAFVIAY